MPTNQESLDVKKAMAYDLILLFKAEEGKFYTQEEINSIINAYILGLSQK